MGLYGSVGNSPKMARNTLKKRCAIATPKWVSEPMIGLAADIRHRYRGFSAPKAWFEIIGITTRRKVHLAV